MPTLKISSQSFNEIATKLKEAGRDVKDNGKILLELDDKIEPPQDVRMMKFRYDAVVEAAKIYNDVMAKSFIEVADEIFKYIQDGTTAKGWK